MTHHLVAYVFQPVPGGAQQNQDAVAQEHHNAVVLARHASPGFLLVSYRRSGGAACALPAVDVSDTELRSSEKPSAVWIAQQQEGHQHEQRLRHQREEQGQQPRERSQSAQGYVRDRDTSNQDEIGLGEYEYYAAFNPRVSDGTADRDDVLWQLEADLQAPGFRDKFKHLFIMWRFLQHVSLSDAGIHADAVGPHTSSHWQRTLDALREPSNSSLGSVAVSLLSNVFRYAVGRATQARSSIYASHVMLSGREQSTVQAVVHLFLRVLTSSSAQYLLLSACQSIDKGTTTQELQERFALLVLDVYNVLDSVLLQVRTDVNGTTRDYPDGPLLALLDDILSLVYRRTQFGDLRAEVTALLMDQQALRVESNALNHVFTLFVKQADVCAIVSVAQGQRVPRQECIVGVPSVGLLSSGWSRRWLLAPESVHVVDAASRISFDASDTSVLCAALLVREFGCIDVEVVEGRLCCLSVRSVLAFAGDVPTAPMELVLDGRQRMFRVLPSGISSTIVGLSGGWVLGDYEAALSDSGQNLEICCFAFADTHTGSEEYTLATESERNTVMMVRQVSLCLSLEQEIDPDGYVGDADSNNQFIAVHGTVYVSTIRAPQGNNVLRPKQREISSADHGAIWNELEWAPLFDFQADYVSI